MVQDDRQSEISGDFALLQNYPNPFNPSTTNAFSIARAGYVTLKVYNTLGQEIAVLFSKELPVSTYTT